MSTEVGFPPPSVGWQESKQRFLSYANRNIGRGSPTATGPSPGLRAVKPYSVRTDVLCFSFLCVVRSKTRCQYVQNS